METNTLILINLAVAIFLLLDIWSWNSLRKELRKMKDSLMDNINRGENKTLDNKVILKEVKSRQIDLIDAVVEAIKDANPTPKKKPAKKKVAKKKK